MRKRKIYPYRKGLPAIARMLRNNSTLSEVLLWKQLKNKNASGYDFHRQKPLLNYIVDFFCHELELAIEIDGASHDMEEFCTNDKKRQSEIEQLGVHFLRFDDREVKHDMTHVLRVIEQYIEGYDEKKKGIASNGQP